MSADEHLVRMLNGAYGQSQDGEDEEWSYVLQLAGLRALLTLREASGEGAVADTLGALEPGALRMVATRVVSELHFSSPVDFDLLDEDDDEEQVIEWNGNGASPGAEDVPGWEE